MDNITWNKLGQDVNAKPVETTEEKKVVLTHDEIKIQVGKLIEQCDALVASANTLYSEFINKELYDSLVMLESGQKSLKKVYIKEPMVDKVLEKAEA
jgi:hypothetical protein